MPSFSKLSVSLMALSGSALAQLPSITSKGSKFFYPNGTQFYIKGVAYQQDTAAAGQGTIGNTTNFKDPLADEDSCKRDVPLLASLGTNTIRTYAIDPTADHSGCMKLLQEAGIYVISDLGNPDQSINRNDPQWNVALYEHYTQVVDELAQYSNVIGFFAGNEVSNAANNTADSAYVKAAVRDTKAYIAAKKNRWMGVGYAANDDEDIRDNIAHYFNCGNTTDAIDFWGYNIYSWCGDSNLQKSGYQLEAEFFSNYSVPVFFAEYGCNQVPGGAANRPFTETTALYGSVMAPVFSGGIVYMYFEEANDFGLVKVSSDGDSVSKLKDFGTLQSKVTAASPSGVSKNDYNPTNSPAACPAVNDGWAASQYLPPTPDAGLCECMVQSSSCVPADNLDSKDYGQIFGYICGQDPKLCAGMNGNATTGVYGAYSMCNPVDQLAYILDGYYKSQNSASTACDFEGKATIQKASTASNCTAALSSASAVNANAATATAGSNNGGSGSGSSSSDGDHDSFGVHAATSPIFSFGNMAIGMYVVVAGVVGAGMVLV